MVAELLSDLRYRFRALFHRGAMEQDLDQELQAHLAFETEKRAQAGLPPEQAARQAKAGVRRRGAGEGAESRRAWDRSARCPVAGPALRLPVASPQSRLHCRRRPHSRARHRRQRRDVRGGGPAALPRTAIPPRRWPGTPGVLHQRRARRAVDPELHPVHPLPRPAAVDQRLRPAGGVQRAHDAGRQRSREPRDAASPRPRRRCGISSTRRRYSAATSPPPRIRSRWERRWRC